MVYSIHLTYELCTHIYIYIYTCMCLYIWNLKDKEQGERERSSHPLSHYEGWAGPKPEAWNFLQSPIWMVGIQVLRPCSAAFPGALVGSWIKSGAVTLE